MPYERALTLLAQAELLHAGRSAYAALSAAQQAQTIFAALEAAPALLRAERLLEQLGQARRCPQPAGLTTREREVLRLVAQGTLRHRSGGAIVPGTAHGQHAPDQHLHQARSHLTRRRRRASPSSTGSPERGLRYPQHPNYVIRRAARALSARCVRAPRSLPLRHWTRVGVPRETQPQLKPAGHARWPLYAHAQLSWR